MALVEGSNLTGTFTSTGTSDSIKVRADSGVLSLDFGTGSVKLSRKNSSGTFVPTGDVFTTDAVKVFNVDGEYELVCDSYTADITYDIRP